MLLSYRDLLEPTEDRTRVTAEITTEHPESHYGQPVVVLEDGYALGMLSVVTMDYQLVEATPDEVNALLEMDWPVDLGSLLYNVDSRFGTETLIATRERWEELLRPRCAEWFAELEEGLFTGTLEEWTEEQLDQGLREVLQ